MMTTECKTWIARLGTTCCHCKVAQLIGLGMLLLGVLVILVGWAAGAAPIGQIGGMVAFTGMVAGLLTRFGAWWHHS